jgi:hypothetical protein
MATGAKGHQGPASRRDIVYQAQRVAAGGRQDTCWGTKEGQARRRHLFGRRESDAMGATLSGSYLHHMSIGVPM